MHLNLYLGAGTQGIMVAETKRAGGWGLALGYHLAYFSRFVGDDVGSKIEKKVLRFPI